MATANYQACVAFVRKQEGGNTDTPGDRGGRTGRGGITHTTYDAYRTAKGLPLQDVWLINDAEIADIYSTEYWAPIHGDDLAPGVDLCIFDYAINSGPEKANWERLKAIAQGYKDSVPMIQKICEDRLSFMQSLRSWSQFGKAWGRRISDCEATALRMANGLTPSVAQAAEEKKGSQSRAASHAVVAGAVGSASAHQWLHDSIWVLAAIIGVFLLLAGIAAFNAWRQGQRADALTAAVKQMQAAQAALAAAKAAASDQAAVREKAIAAEQAALTAANDAIGKI